MYLVVVNRETESDSEAASGGKGAASGTADDAGGDGGVGSEQTGCKGGEDQALMATSCNFLTRASVLVVTGDGGCCERRGVRRGVGWEVWGVFATLRLRKL